MGGMTHFPARRDASPEKAGEIPSAEWKFGLVVAAERIFALSVLGRSSAALDAGSELMLVGNQ
jgi:hypothetical protein